MLKRVYAFRRDRLGSALLNLAHAWRFAERFGAELVCLWVKQHHRRGDLDLNDLFTDLPFEVQDDTTGSERAYIDSLPNLLTLIPNLAAARHKGFDPAILENIDEVHYAPTGPLFPIGDSAEQAIAEARSKMATIRLSQELASTWSEIRSRFDFRSTVAVHIRRGDVIDVLRAYNMMTRASGTISCRS